MRILFLGDLVGRPARRAVAEFIAVNRERLGIDVIIANSDNLAHGRGVTRKTLEEMLASGVDILTSGDHAWDNPQALESLKAGDLAFVMPTNIEKTDPLLGARVFEVREKRLLVINLLGRVFLDRGAVSPFAAADAILKKYEGEHVDAALVDFHAEATSEKKALAMYLDGRVAAVLGTHTHVQTADAEVLKGGTAFISDAGMTGVKASILGCDPEAVLRQFTAGEPFKYKIVPEGTVSVQGVILEVGEDGRAVAIERLQHDIEVRK